MNKVGNYTQSFFQIVLLVVLLSACNQQTAPSQKLQNLTLIPLSPYQYEFSGQAGKNRNDYYFVDFKRANNGGDIKDTISKLVNTAKAKKISAFQHYSIYVYERTEKLNASFSGSMDDLRGVHDNSLISFTRWTKGSLDVFYYIESGHVVYDIFEKRKISPSWEFD